MPQKAIAVIALFLLLTFASLTAETAEKPNFILITVDCLRADRLPAHGYEVLKTPAIDQLVSEGVLFEKCTAQAPWTIPSMASMLTSLYPTSCSVYDNIHRLDPNYTTMAELFYEKGYMTGIISGHSVIASPKMGLLQGFQYCNGGVTIENKVNFRTLLPALFEFLHNYHHRPIFLWIHFMELHRPTTRENPYLSQYTSYYDAEIRLVNDHLERIFTELKTLGLYENSYICFTADHGEHLGLPPHKLIGHQNSVYEALNHIPFILRGPGIPQGKRISSIIELTDLMPTFLELADIEAQSVLQGHSLLPLIRGEVKQVRDYAVAERPYMREPSTLPYSLHTFSIRDERYKMIVQVPDPSLRSGREPWNWDIEQDGASIRLFDLDNDPVEAEDLAGKPEHKKEYNRLLEAFLEFKEHQSVMFEIGPGVALTNVDPEIRRRLEAIGYTVE